MEIRAYEARDEEAVAALWTRVFARPEPRNEPRRVIAEKMAVQSELFVVAVDGGAVVGTAMGGYDGHRGWLYTVAVDPGRQRRGVGTALVKHLEGELAARGCSKVNLQVLASNAAVVEFYRRLGFAVEERVSMGKVLAG